MKNQILFTKYNSLDIERNEELSSIKLISRIKVGVKKIFEFLYTPFKYGMLYRIRKQIWDLDGHLLESTYDIKNNIWDVEERLKNEIQNIRDTIQIKHNSNFQELSSKLDILEDKIRILTDYVDLRMESQYKVLNNQIWKAEEILNQKLDTRIWKAELEIKKSIIKHIWIIDRKITKQYGIGNKKGNNFIYDVSFYENNQYSSFVSGIEVLKKIIVEYNPSSIIDFGCGTGTWLAAAKVVNPGIEILGIDGDYVDRSMLMVSEEEFIPKDLSKIVILNRKFDMAISMEVAEHIDEKYADCFIDNICRHSNMVLFSAAHIGQGGDGHINEQPLEYWIKKFMDREYFYIDIRGRYQSNYNIESWYRENIALFIKNGINNI